MSLSTTQRKKSRVFAFWRWPIWLFEFLTTGKSFKDNPLLGQYWLNWLGLHVFRYVMAHAITQLRWWQLRWMLTPAERASFHRDGFLQINNFLQPDLFTAVAAQAQAGADTVRQLTQQDTLTQRFLIDEAIMAQRPALDQLFKHKRLDRLLKYCGARNKKSLYYAQVIKNGVRSAAEDPQKNLHSDTFHPTLKAWLFLADVTPDDGPLTYIPGSHRLTLARLKFEYQRSLSVLTHPDGYSEKGSMRLKAADAMQLQLQLPAPIAFCVPANTLVLANTHGFHARGQALPGRCRPEIWMYSRHNPFNPCAGLDFRWVSKLSHRILNKMWVNADVKSAQHGKSATWVKITAAEFEKRYPQAEVSGHDRSTD